MGKCRRRAPPCAGEEGSDVIPRSRADLGEASAVPGGGGNGVAGGTLVPGAPVPIRSCRTRGEGRPGVGGEKAGSEAKARRAGGDQSSSSSSDGGGGDPRPGLPPLWGSPPMIIWRAASKLPAASGDKEAARKVCCLDSSSSPFGQPRRERGREGGSEVSPGAGDREALQGSGIAGASSLSLSCALLGKGESVKFSKPRLHQAGCGSLCRGQPDRSGSHRSRAGRSSSLDGFFFFCLVFLQAKKN